MSTAAPLDGDRLRWRATLQRCANGLFALHSGCKRRRQPFQPAGYDQSVVSVQLSACASVWERVGDEEVEVLDWEVVDELACPVPCSPASDAGEPRSSAPKLHLHVCTHILDNDTEKINMTPNLVDTVQIEKCIIGTIDDEKISTPPAVLKSVLDDTTQIKKSKQFPECTGSLLTERQKKNRRKKEKKSEQEGKEDDSVWPTIIAGAVLAFLLAKVLKSK